MSSGTEAKYTLKFNVAKEEGLGCIIFNRENEGLADDDRGKNFKYEPKYHSGLKAWILCNRKQLLR